MRPAFFFGGLSMGGIRKSVLYALKSVFLYVGEQSMSGLGNLWTLATTKV